MSLSKERETAIREHANSSMSLDHSCLTARQTKELLTEIDRLRDEDFAASSYEWQKQALEARRERDYLETQRKGLRDELEKVRQERDELERELRGKPLLNIRASDAIPKLFDEIDSLTVELLEARESNLKYEKHLQKLGLVLYYTKTDIENWKHDDIIIVLLKVDIPDVMIVH